MTRPAVIILGLTTAAAIALQTVPRPVRVRLVAEHGPVETATSVVIGLGIVVMAMTLVRRLSLVWLSGLAMWIWGFLRELDFQKKFTYRSVESIGYYVRPHAPWSEKLLVLLILLPFVMAGFHLLITLIKSLPRGLSQRQAWVGSLACAFALGATASASEKLFKLVAVEEVCELGLVTMLLLMVLQLRGGSQNAKTSEASAKSSGRLDEVR